MKLKTSILLGIYWLAVISDLIIVILGNDRARFISKPALMIILMIAYAYQSGLKSPFSKLILTALFFSWMGDVLLLWDSLFIGGLLSFLLAHIFYITYFIKTNSRSKGLLQFQPLIGIPVLVYEILLLWVLWPYLDQLKIPVLVYATVLCLMLLCAINTYWKIDRDSAILFFNGALQFLISDTLLAIHKFIHPFAALPVAVMITYSSAQFLITLGSIYHLKTEQKPELG